ncbi:MAG: PAS domain S-box protein [Bacteroidota bacterium]|nr:PAS domain S-box protein [Bacteroidota bacterium]
MFFSKIQKIFVNFSLRTKLIISSSFLVTAISVFIFIYFPSEFEEQATKAIVDKANSIATMTAFSISPALFFNDTQTIKEAFQSARLAKDIVYIVLRDDSNKVYYAYNLADIERNVFKQNVNGSRITGDGMIYEKTVPIYHTDKVIGNLTIGFSLVVLESEVQKSRAAITFVALLIFFGSLFIVIGISSVITRPLRSIVNTVEDISSGNLRSRATIVSEDEVGQLAKSFNIMVDKLAEALDEIENANRSLETKVDQRTNELKLEIIERKRIADALRESETKLRNIIEHSTNLFYSHSVDHVLTYISPQSKTFFDYEPEEAMFNWTKLLTDNPENLKGIQLTQRAIDIGKVQPSYQLELVGKLGRKIWVEVNEAPVVRNGKTVAIVGSLTDISERKKVEEFFHKYEFIVNASPDYMTLVDTGYRYVAVNNSYCIAHKKSREEILGKKVSDIWGNEVFDTIIKKNFDASFNGNIVNYKSWFEFPETGLRYFDVTHSPYRDSNGNITHVVAISRDITEKWKAEAELIQSEERYRNFFEEDLTGDFISNSEGNIITCNAAFVKIFGFVSIDSVLSSSLQNLFYNESEFQKFLIRLKSSKKIEYMELELRRIDGRILHTVQNVIGDFDANGNLLTIKGYIFDDTKRKLLEGQLLQAQKMESLGTLASGIAHDFNNILAIVLGYASQMESDEYVKKNFLKNVKAIAEAVQRGSGMVKQLLTFSRKTDLLTAVISLNSVIEEFVKLLNETFPKTIEIQIDLDRSIPAIRADINQVHQILLNLSLNAKDAMDKGGVLKISTSLVTAEILSKKFTNVNKEKYVCISVSDAGHGMDEETRLRIFEPFFTTKEIGKGTGLGLAVVYGVVQSHHGFIDVESEIDSGTIFNIYLPAYNINSIPDDAGIQEQECLLQGTETILVVEDELMLSDLVKEILQERGYKVLTAFDGESGIEIFKKHQNEIAIIFSDIGLPKMSGWEMYNNIRNIAPNTKIIFASGYLDPPIWSEMFKIGIKEIVQKPYDPIQIIKKVRQLLDTKDV